MKKISTETKVGLFALLILSILTYMTFRVSGTEWFRKGGYTLYVDFHNVAGLDERTRIKIAGVDAGIIDDITLKGSVAHVKLRIFPGIEIYRDAVASIKSTGLLGDKYLEIKPGTAGPPLKEGDTIKYVQEPVDIERVVKNLVDVTDSIIKLTENINDIFGAEETRTSLKETARNLSRITENLNKSIVVNDQKLRETLDGIKNLTASLQQLVNENREGITTSVTNISKAAETFRTEAPVLIERLNSMAEELRGLIQEGKPRLLSIVQKTDETLDNVKSITEKINRGEGTLGKLVTDESLYNSVNSAAKGVERTIAKIERFRTYLTFRGEYLSELSDGKGYFYLTLKPRPDKYYILGIVGDPIGRVTTTETITTRNGITTVEKEEEIEKRIEFTAQFAKRFDNTALRIGITENTFGVGADQFFLDDRLKLSADIWDFGNDEEGAKNPHLKIGIDYNIYNGLFISGGIDNILNSKWRGLFIGGGVTFEDEDFKYLFGTVPRIPTK
jgi:phospholipid/cholesterol/gamma-HCH transport system substrate-binding protein